MESSCTILANLFYPFDLCHPNLYGLSYLRERIQPSTHIVPDLWKKHLGFVLILRNSNRSLGGALLYWLNGSWLQIHTSSLWGDKYPKGRKEKNLCTTFTPPLHITITTREMLQLISYMKKIAPTEVNFVIFSLDCHLSTVLCSYQRHWLTWTVD